MDYNSTLRWFMIFSAIPDVIRQSDAVNPDTISFYPLYFVPFIGIKLIGTVVLFHSGHSHVWKNGLLPVWFSISSDIVFIVMYRWRSTKPEFYVNNYSGWIGCILFSSQNDQWKKPVSASWQILDTEKFSWENWALTFITLNGMYKAEGDDISGINTSRKKLTCQKECWN